MTSSSDTTPGHILQVGMGFWASKTLLSAVELELVTVLGDGTMTGPEIGDRLGLHPRGLFDFLDALVSLGLLERSGDGRQAGYRNTTETARFLDKGQPTYVGGILEMSNSRLYGFWANLTEALRTGEPQNEIKHGGDFFGALYADETRLEECLRAMQVSPGVVARESRCRVGPRLDGGLRGRAVRVGGVGGTGLAR